MRRPARFALTVLAAVSVGSALFVMPASAGVPIERTPGETSYDYPLRGNSNGKTWRGTGSITFANTGADPLPEVYVRLWSNGVLGCEGYSIAVSNMQGGAVTASRLACTELEVTLDAPLMPAASTTISFDLRIRLPAVDDRFGFHDGLALAGTALPILDVRDDRGWHHAPFENLGESFYSVVADYEVTLVTRPALDTAATGVVTDRRPTGHHRVKTTYTAEQVRDFAWAAGSLRTVVRSARGTDVVVSYQPTAVPKRKARDAADDAIRVLRTLGDAFGDYPYPEVDVVLAGDATFGGMEYPTIVFSVPNRLTIAHELAHQWFYGTVGNDQYREPWLDESFATWAMRLPFAPRAGCKRISWPSAQAALTNDMGYWARHPTQYGLVYVGGACMLANLSKRFGSERFLRVVGRYARGHSMDIARTEDFMGAIERAAERHLDGFNAAAYWARWRVEPS